MFDSKMLLVILAIALVIFGTKRLRSIGSDLGGAVKGFKQAVNEAETEAHESQVARIPPVEANAPAPSSSSPGA